MHIMSIISRLRENRADRGRRGNEDRWRKKKVEKERHKNTRHNSPLIYDIIHNTHRINTAKFSRTHTYETLLCRKTRNVKL